MARKKKELPLLSDVEILDVAAEGNSIARVDEMVVLFRLELRATLRI